MSTKSNFTICFTPYSGKILFSNARILILLFSNGTIMVGNIICNFLVMLIIIRTEQISNTACKIFFQISFADFLVGSITQPLYMVILLFRETLCILELVHTFIATALVTASLYTIGLLGVDRYIRIKYLAKFGSILPSRRVCMIMFFLWVLACVRATLTLKSYLDEKQIFLLLNSTLAGIVFLAMIILQAISVYAIRHVTRKSRFLTKCDQQIKELSSYYLEQLQCFWCSVFRIL